ncbi:MAG: thioredoxin family protein [Candidatus Bathyarchaeia archaeon]
MPVKVEVFTSEPPCSGGRLLLKLIEKIKEEYKDKIEVEIYRGINPKLSEYDINSSPAVVIDKDIRIIGICPSEETIKEALREAGISE